MLKNCTPPAGIGPAVQLTSVWVPAIGSAGANVPASGLPGPGPSCEQSRLMLVAPKLRKLQPAGRCSIHVYRLTPVTPLSSSTVNVWVTLCAITDVFTDAALVARLMRRSGQPMVNETSLSWKLFASFVSATVLLKSICAATAGERVPVPPVAGHTPW